MWKRKDNVITKGANYENGAEMGGGGSHTSTTAATATNPELRNGILAWDAILQPNLIG